MADLSWFDSALEKALLSLSTTTTTTIFIRAQKLYSVNINTRKKKLQRKRAQPLRNSKLIELSGWAKRKKICKYPKSTYNYGHILPFTQTHAHTITIDRGKCTSKNWKIKYINEPVSSWR